MKSALDILNPGLTPNLPCFSPFAEAWCSGAFFMAQSGGGIESVPADFVKNFLIMFGFVTIGAGAYIFGRRGSKGNPMHLESPVNVDATVSHAPVYAHHSELDAIKQDIERRSRENLRQHEDHREQLAEVIAAGNDRLQSMLTALHEMENRMTTATLSEIRGLHERINPLAEKVSANDQAITGMKDRIQHLWEMIQQLWSQVFRKTAPRS
jgi:hypothetical protein